MSFGFYAYCALEYYACNIKVVFISLILYHVLLACRNTECFHIKSVMYK